MTTRSCHACGALVIAAAATVCPQCGTLLEATLPPASADPVVPAAVAAEPAPASPFHLPGDDGTFQTQLRDELARREAERQARHGEWSAALATRVEPVMAVLAEAQAAGRPILVQLDRDGLGTGASSVSIHLDQRPAGRVDARVAIALRRMHPERFETVGPTMADLRRDGVLRSFGWAIEVGVLASRSFEINPSDRAAVTDMVDALQRALDVAEMPLDAPWQLSVAAPETAASGLALDEAWVEDASAEQFRGRLVSLSRLRGGRIVVRFARNERFTVAVTTRHAGASVQVRAADAAGGSDTGGHWRREWTQDQEMTGAAAIFADILAALAERLPGEQGAVAIRLEERPAELGWQKAKDTGWLLGWVVGVLLVAVPWALLSDILHTDFIDALAAMLPGMSSRAAAALVVVPALSSMAFVFLTTGIAGRIADARSIRYDSGVWLIRIAAVAGSAVYFAALALAGGLWLPVAIAPALLLLIGGAVRFVLR